MAIPVRGLPLRFTDLARMISGGCDQPAWPRYTPGALLGISYSEQSEESES